MKSPDSFETSVISYQPKVRNIRHDYSFKTNVTKERRATIFVKASVIYRFWEIQNTQFHKIINFFIRFSCFMYIIKTEIKNDVLLTTSNKRSVLDCILQGTTVGKTLL
jgi:hypothetical protein